MAKIKKSSFLNEVSGKIGDLVVRQTKGGPNVLTANGVREKHSPKQKENNDRFQFASRYAKTVTAHPPLKEQYARRITDKLTSAYTVALADAMNPPEIKYIQTRFYTGAIGSLITIKATDDFRVDKVQVLIQTADGKRLEGGYAERNKRKPLIWNYRATVENPSVTGCKIMAIAEDLPGNKVSAEVVVE